MSKGGIQTGNLAGLTSCYGCFGVFAMNEVESNLRVVTGYDKCFNKIILADVLKILTVNGQCWQQREQLRIIAIIKFKGNGSMDKTNASGNKKQWAGSGLI